MNILAELRRRFAVALVDLTGDAAASELAGMVLSSQDPKFGDYQANCAMPLGKRLGKPPREVAASLIEKLDLSDLCDSPDIAGPGFINLRLRDAWIAEQLQLAASDLERAGVEKVASPRSFVIDFASPNVAKPMHVGHIRSTVIGDSLSRILKFLGHRVITDNHIGDWGTQFGMIIFGWKHFGDEGKLAAEPVAHLTEVYKEVNTLVEYLATRDEKIPAAEKRIVEQEARLSQLKKMTLPADAKEAKKHTKQLEQATEQVVEAKKELGALHQFIRLLDEFPDFRKRVSQYGSARSDVLRETAALHAGDPTNRGLWDRFLPACLAEMNSVFDRLGVKFDHTLGESFYEDKLAGVVADLRQRGLARESEGAMCVFLDGYETPFIVQKQDGAYLYATTDLATIQYRMHAWQPDALLYVVDSRQSLHFEQLFAAAKKWGYDQVEYQHISFGTVLGDDGRPFKTRSGSSVGLNSLLDEAIERALAIVSENDDARPQPLLTADERRRVAERIGIGAIKYADLAHNRTSDYKFSYDKMLAMTGNTAAYMQYSYARVRSIFDKAIADFGLRISDFSNQSTIRHPQSEITLSHPAERALGLAILRFSEALDRVVADYRPNHLTDYLFDLASKYAAFFENCPVLRAETDELRTSRLLLCDLTARTLQRGLALLGIEVVERM